MNAIEVLYHEHRIIESALDRVCTMKKDTEQKNWDEEQTITHLRAGVEFFRFYADRLHHEKEEVVLFPEAVRRDAQLATGVVQELLEHHRDFRQLISEVSSALDQKDVTEALERLECYAVQLREHIAIENDEFFPGAGDLFTSEELATLGFRFADIDQRLGLKKKAELEQQFG